MDLHDYLRALRKRWVSALVIALAVTGLAGGASYMMEPQYTASARMFFAVQSGTNMSDIAQGSNFTEKQMVSYAQVATSERVLTEVIDDLDLDMEVDKLKEVVTAAVPPNTVILQISATDPDPVLAAAIANSVAEHLADAASDLSPDRADGGESVLASTLDSAKVPTEPSSPKTTLNILAGIVAGAVLGALWALLREVLDTKVRDKDDVAVVTDTAIIGTVGNARRDSDTDSPIFMHTQPLGHRAEAVRRTRTNLQFVDLDGDNNTVVVTSSVPGEGKTTMSLNLAAAFADNGERVLLVDADLRRPSVARYLAMEGAVGLTTVVTGQARLADVTQPVGAGPDGSGDGNLHVLPSGAIPPNPAELLDSKAMERLIAEASAMYDKVIIDSPPLLPVTDAAILARKTKGATIVVAGADRLRKNQLRESLASLEKVSARLAGVLLNKVSGGEAVSSYRYGYYTADAPAVRRRSARRARRRDRAVLAGRA